MMTIRTREPAPKTPPATKIRRLTSAWWWKRCLSNVAGLVLAAVLLGLALAVVAAGVWGTAMLAGNGWRFDG